MNFNVSLIQRDNTQSEVIVVNADIDSSINRVKKDFSEGQFEDSMTFLDELLKDNEKIKEIKYHLLITKVDFLRQFRRFDEFIEYIEIIEQNEDYIPYINTKFKELKLTLLSLNKDDSFFKLSKELRLDTPNSKPQGHFDLVYYLNNGDLKKAKEIFDEEIKNIEFQKHLFLLGGHIYSMFYKYDDKENQEYFDKADYYYQKALEESKLDYLDKFEIQKFYGIHNINHFMMRKNHTDLEYLKEYKHTLDNIYISKKYFSEHYIQELLESYIHTLLILDMKEEYFKLYEENKDKLPIRYYLQYCEVKEIKYSHLEIQEHLKSNFNLQDLIIYSSFIKDRDINEKKEVIEFLKNNIEYIYKDSFVFHCFVKGYILTNDEIDTLIYKYLVDNQYENIDFLLTFIDYKMYLKGEIKPENLDKLLEFSDNCIYPRLLDSIEILSKMKRTEYLQFALNNEQDFKGIIFETLKICEVDEDLLFDSFHNFVEQIKNKDSLYMILGRIYSKYNKSDIAFDYYYLEFQKNKNINAMFELLNIAHFLFSRSGEKIEYQKQKEVFSSLLAEANKFEIENLLFLLGYEITLLQSTSSILPLLNKKLLEQDISSLENKTKVSLSNIFVQTEFHLHNYKELFLIGDNLCFVRDGITYIKDNYMILEENQKNYGLESIDDNEFFLKERDNDFVKNSIFHRIVGPFAFGCDNPAFLPMKMDDTKENPLEDLFEFMKNQTDNEKELFQRYSNGIEIGLFSLSHRSYKNYFELVPFLLESNNINFISGRINFQDKSVNKILTLSSIIFLNQIGYLEQVLQREDIYIQRTVINWLKEYSRSIDISDMPTKFDYLNETKPNFYRNSDEEVEELRILLNKLIKLILENCKTKIIDDHLEILPIKGAYEILSKNIGNQEFQGYSYSINHKFQIITEDTIYQMLFDVFRNNINFVSNSLSLLEEILTYEELRELKISLFNKNYKYVLSEQYINGLMECPQ